MLTRVSSNGIVIILLYVDDMVITESDLEGIDNLKRYLSSCFQMKDLGFLRSLNYLTITRPDISHAVHIVSQFMSAPRSTHFAAVLRILRYLKGTLYQGLQFSSKFDFTLRAYSYSDWAGDVTNRRSITGYCMFLGDSFISWRSKKQTIVSRSSAEE
ncbi:uncharacterized protein LOC113324597 [Papaver somniferum]|uniref:uncharacterized protein LOC113324597 n=1 Tax=Papaver somniferum TaxID=3469 RepID=UPI000E6F55C2|nr:uncharacterized protein LOC113324597 [Papaver somniferum]